MCSKSGKFIVKGFKQIILIRGLVFALCIIISFQAKAQYSGYEPVSNLPAFREKFSTESSKISSMASTFTQEKILTALTEKIISGGNFKFKRNNKVRIEYTSPYRYLMIMNGDKMLVKDDQKENRINVRSNKLFQQINRIMIDCFQGTILSSEDFTVKVYENRSNYLLEMTPVSKTLKEFFTTIVLLVEKEDYSVKSIDMNEPSGDKTIMTFTEKKINISLSDAVFAL